MIASKLPDQFPRLETERLILRQLTSADRQAIFQNYSTIELNSVHHGIVNHTGTGG